MTTLGGRGTEWPDSSTLLTLLPTWMAGESLVLLFIASENKRFVFQPLSSGPYHRFLKVHWVGVAASLHNANNTILLCPAGHPALPQVPGPWVLDYLPNT